MSSTFRVQSINGDRPFFIGRGKDTDFVLQDQSVSRRHAKIEKLGEKWLFTNLSKTSGTLFDGKEINTKEIEDGDVFLLGLQQLRFSIKEGELFLSHVKSIEDVPAIPLSESKNILLGRGNSEEIPGAIVHPACPKNLAVARLDGKRMKLVFSHSLFKRVEYLENGETLKLPWCLLEFRGGNLFIHQKDVGFSLAVKDASARIGGKDILKEIRFSLPAGKILAVIGQSGQGKSTLLELLTGKVELSQGFISIDGFDYEESSIRKEIAYLPQEPLLRDSLTVKETLLHAARISLPKDYSKEDALIRARKLITLFGISNLEERRIAVLSGGERRRTALAAQLMGAPGLILLDEPLSGLDPMNAKRLCAHLRELSKFGHTVLLTTHSYEALQIADEVLVIHKGEQGFYGAPQDAFRYFNAEDPEGILETLDDKTAANWEASGRKTAIEKPVFQRSKFPRVPKKETFFYFLSLLFKQWMRDRGKAISLTLQPVVIGILLSQIFSSTASLWVAAFALVLCANWFALSLSVREIVQEKSLLLEEFRKGQGIFSVLFSKLVFSAFFAFLETVICYAFFARTICVPPTPALFFIFAVTVIPAASMGLFLSVFSKNPGQANAFLPLVIIPQVALSGALVSVDQMAIIAKALSKIVWTSYDQSALQSVFTGISPAISDLMLPLLIAFIIYIISFLALEKMKNAK